METTHEQVERIARKKRIEESSESMRELANKDINLFIQSCRMSGFSSGIKVGFFLGVFASIITYFVIN